MLDNFTVPEGAVEIDAPKHACLAVTFSREMGNHIRYFDWTTRDALQAMYLQCVTDRKVIMFFLLGAEDLE